jgi:hypothetical protein
MTPEEAKREVSSRISHEDMASFSALSYGAAGAGLAIVLLLAQIWTSPPKLLHVWAVALAAIAMPLYVAVGVFDQIWHSFKLPFVELHVGFPKVSWLRTIAWYSAALCLITSVDCVLFGLSPLAGGIFTGVALGALLGVFMAWRHAGGRALMADFQRRAAAMPRDK